MNKSLFILSFLSFLTIGLYAQENQVVKTDSIIFDKIAFDYGTIEQGSDGSCEFNFTNKGMVPLILNNVHASCGCTIPEWPKEPIEPGKKGVIKVKYNTNIIGSFSKSITVYSNAKNAQVVLLIRGNVTSKQ
jgi:hypothetical protein